MKELKYSMPAGQDLVNIAGATDRYALYKVGPVLAASVSFYKFFFDIEYQKFSFVYNHKYC